MFQWLKNWKQERILHRSSITQDEWNDAFHNLPLLHRLNNQEKTKLKKLAILFLHYKTLETVGDIELTTAMRLTIALQACLLILNLGLDWYEGWIAVVIYPGAFSIQRKYLDEYGIEHIDKVNLSGESWQRGPVILSWYDSSHPNEIADGHNVVLHEFAHKLDMLNGKANGFPPLHKDMSAEEWADVFTKAYNDFELHLQQDDFIPIDSYAAESPAEFFAVFSELFFEKPMVVKEYYPDVYNLLLRFYRQDPMGKLARN